MSAARIPDPRLAVRQEAARILRGPPYDLNAVCVTGASAIRLGMDEEARTMFRLAVEILHHFIRKRDAAVAIVAEGNIYDLLVKAVESEEHYERCFAQWREPMLQLGRAFQKPLRLPPDARTSKRIAFIFHGGVVLGHTEVLMRLLEKREPGREASIYALFGCNDDFVARAAALGVPVEAYGGSAEGPAQWLRERMAARGEACAVWVAAPPAALFVLAARVAPVQVFWTLKFHAIRAPEIDGYITYGSWGEREKTFHGQAWTVCPVPLALDPRPAAAAEVAALRARFPEKVLLGTLAREDKIDSRPFLESVAALLARHPQCGYVWTGRERHAGIDEFFGRAGVADRCHFVGWVDTPLYAAILDVFLETFPLGCGITGYQALGAGVPLVSYLDANTVFGMQYRSDLVERAGALEAVTREMLDEYPVLVARDPREYVEIASRVIEDAEFRARWLARERRFYDEEIAGIERYSRRFFGTLDAVRARVLGP